MSENQRVKIFVSGKYADREQIHQKIQHLRSLNYEITHDWTQIEESDRSPEAMREYAQFDINGALEADVHIVEMTDPAYAYRGTFTELGATITQKVLQPETTRNKHIFIICPFLHEKSETYPNPTTNPFFWHPVIEHYMSWSKVISQLDHLYKI